ncbi:YoaK family protein [Rhizobium sp. A22-96]
MLISQGAARSERINLQLACSLAGIAGALNAAAFYAVGFFSANMTGNVSSLSDHLATMQWLAAAFYFAIVVTFIAGSTLSSLLINAGRRRGIEAIYAYSILAEAILLVPLGAADLWLNVDWRSSLEVLGLAFLMGLQNATVTRLSDARVRTTHVSGMATDIGVELGMLVDIWRGRESQSLAADNRSKLALHLGTISAFLIGGIAGVMAYRIVGGYLLLICAVVLLAISLTGIRHARTLVTTASRRVSRHRRERP